MCAVIIGLCSVEAGLPINSVWHNWPFPSLFGVLLGVDKVQNLTEYVIEVNIGN